MSARSGFGRAVTDPHTKADRKNIQNGDLQNLQVTVDRHFFRGTAPLVPRRRAFPVGENHRAASERDAHAFGEGRGRPGRKHGVDRRARRRAGRAPRRRPRSSRERGAAREDRVRARLRRGWRVRRDRHGGASARRGRGSGDAPLAGGVPARGLHRAARGCCGVSEAITCRSPLRSTTRWTARP